MLSADVYDAYGKVTAGAQPDPWGFGAQAGYYTDRETGLVLLTHRYYDPAQGRFLTRDPMGYGGGINLYGYVGNSPVNGMDPSGLEPGYWQTAGSFGLGELKGFGNFLASGSEGTAFGFATGGRFSHPFGSGGSENEQDGQSTGDTIALVGSFFTGEGEAVGIGRLFRGPCFVAGTPVQMADGSTKAVEQIRPGDIVQSRDPDSGKTETKKVMQTFVSQVHSVVTLKLGDPKTGVVLETLTCTSQHPFYVAGKGFTPAGQLTVGASLATRSGLTLTVLSVNACSSDKGYTVYNFEVSDDHTYFVGKVDGGTWVHNDCTNVAADIIKERIAAGLESGEVWKVERTTGSLFGYRGIKYGYHDVVRVGDQVIDTLTHGHKNLVDIGQWQQNFSRVVGADGYGFHQFFDFSSGSGAPKAFAKCMSGR